MDRRDAIIHLGAPSLTITRPVAFRQGTGGHRILLALGENGRFSKRISRLYQAHDFLATVATRPENLQMPYL